MTPQWLEITLRSNSEADAERIEAALEAAGAIAITYTAADDEEIYEPASSRKTATRKPSTSCCAPRSATTSR